MQNIKYKIRYGKISDLYEIYLWESDINIKKNYFNQKFYSLNEHIKWWKINIKKNNLYIIEDIEKKLKIGLISIKREKKYANIGIIISPIYRGRGLCTHILNSYLNKFNKNLHHKANIKVNNHSSIICFKKAGFNAYSIKDELVKLVK